MKFRSIYLAFLCFGLSSEVYGQYRVRTHDLLKTITSLSSDDDGRIIYGTDEGEIGYFDGLQTERIAKVDAVIHRVMMDGKAWTILTSKGVYTKKNEDLVLETGSNIDVLAANKDLSLLATRSGIFKKIGQDYRPEGEAFYGIDDIQNAHFFEINNIPHLRIDHRIFAYDKRWQEKIIHPDASFSLVVRPSSFIIADSVSIAQFDHQGYVDTLARLDTISDIQIFPISDNSLLVSGDNRLQILNIRKKELKRIYDLNTSLVKDAVTDKWANLWLSAGSFIYQLIDIKNKESMRPPLLDIEEVTVNGKIVDPTKKLKLKKDKNDLIISYRGVQLTSPQDLTYQSRIFLEGKNRYESTVADLGQWTPYTKDRQIQYRNLPPGSYTIEIRATVDEEYYTYVVPSIKVDVEDDTFQKIWLVGILGALGILLSGIYFNTRYNRLKEKSDQERKLLLQENKMLMLQQKALQLQMNPHFVFNALNSIQGLIAKGDNKNARRYLQQFSSMMRSVLHQSREETISLEDEITYLTAYLHLEQMANNQSFDFKIDVSENVDDDIRIPTMIIQPFIENAIMHGVKMLKSRRGEIIVEFHQKASLIVCTVTDNGVGREIASSQKSSSHKSVALDVVRERLQARNIHREPIRFEDLKDREGNPLGTRVILHISHTI